MPNDASAEPLERGTAKRRATLGLSMLKGETSVGEAARRHGLTVAEVKDWRDCFLLGAENALRSRPKDEEATYRGTGTKTIMLFNFTTPFSGKMRTLKKSPKSVNYLFLKRRSRILMNLSEIFGNNLFCLFIFLGIQFFDF